MTLKQQEEGIVADKKASNGTPQEQPNELDKLRSIVFGDAKSDLESHIQRLEANMTERFKRAEQAFNKKLQSLHNQVQDSLKRLDDKLDDIDNQHDAKEAELNAYADKLASELEMTDTSHQQDSEALHSRIDEELDRLTRNYDKRLSETLKKLENVNHELDTSKTDRKTLAKLLTEVANGLAADPK